MKEVEPTFEISTWEGEELMKLKPQAPNYSAEELSKSPEIGVWNGNAMDLSHLTEMPIFTIIIDTCISEKSTDILTWIQQRYGLIFKTIVKFIECSINLYFEISQTTLLRCPAQCQFLSAFWKWLCTKSASLMHSFHAYPSTFKDCSFPRFVSVVASSSSLPTCADSATFVSLTWDRELSIWPTNLRQSSACPLQ